jgi:hypothetical protein
VGKKEKKFLVKELLCREKIIQEIYMRRSNAELVGRRTVILIISFGNDLLIKEDLFSNQQVNRGSCEI